jgi:drug/metabolite transporter (DMT)-like permease
LSAAVGFALLSLVCAGLTDIVHKRYSQVARSRGLYVLAIGVVWTLLQAAIVIGWGTGLRFDATTLAFGLGAGLLVALANIFLIEGLTHVDVGLGSTIYRLNTIAVVIMAVFLLDEPMTLLKATGIAFGVAAVFLLYEPGRTRAQPRDVFVLFFAFGVVASLLRAGFGVVSKMAALRHVDLATMLLVNAPVWIVVGAFYAFTREKRVDVRSKTLLYAASAGILICGVANFLMLAVARGEASVVVPIANMSFVVALAISVILGMERMQPRKAAAIGLAIASIAVLSLA